MAGPVGTRVKDYLARLGAEQAAAELLWRLRFHRQRLTRTLIMTPVPLPGVAPGPRIVEVPPAAVTHLATQFVWERHYRDAFAFAGNWDERIRGRRPPFGEHPPQGWYDLGGYAHHTVLDIFVRGLDVRETAEYAHLAERIERGGRPRGWGSPDQLDAHFQQLIEDYERMQRGLFGRPAGDGRLVAHQVNVFVDRHGALIHRSQGFHQLRIAELLEVERVPVRVLAVHADWLLPELDPRSDDLPSDVQSALCRLGAAPEPDVPAEGDR